MFPEHVVERVACCAEPRFAVAVAFAHHSREIVLNDVKSGKIDARRGRCRSRHDELDRSARGGGARPFDVEIGFAFLAYRSDPWVFAIQDDIAGVKIGGESEHGPKTLHVLKLEVCFSDDGNGLARSVVGSGEEGLGIVNGGEIARAHAVKRKIGIEGIWKRKQRCEAEFVNLAAKFAENPCMGFAREVVEGDDAGDDGCERGRNLGVGGIGEVILCADVEAMDFRAEGVANLADVSRELDGRAARANVDICEALRREPLRDGDKI